MRPPNYTLLMIWIPVILLASVIGYLKRENLYMLYDTRYWAVAAMVWERLCKCTVEQGFTCWLLLVSTGLGICDDIRTDVESHTWTTFCTS